MKVYKGIQILKDLQSIQRNTKISWSAREYYFLIAGFGQVPSSRPLSDIIYFAEHEHTNKF